MAVSAIAGPDGALDTRPPAKGRSMRDVVALFYAIKPLRFLLIASALHAVVLLVAQSWSAGFYSRSFGMPSARSLSTWRS